MGVKCYQICILHSLIPVAVFYFNLAVSCVSFAAAAFPVLSILLQSNSRHFVGPSLQLCCLFPTFMGTLQRSGEREEPVKLSDLFPQGDTLALREAMSATGLKWVWSISSADLSLIYFVHSLLLGPHVGCLSTYCKYRLANNILSLSALYSSTEEIINF